MTGENVDRVLDDVRPYLIADGGNVTVVSVEDGVISLKLEVFSCTLAQRSHDGARDGEEELCDNQAAP